MKPNNIKPIQEVVVPVKKEEPTIIDVSLRGKYLPNILVKLGEFANNAEARKFIRQTGVIVDDNLTKDIDYPISDCHLIEIHAINYKVRLI